MIEATQVNPFSGAQASVEEVATGSAAFALWALFAKQTDVAVLTVERALLYANQHRSDEKEKKTQREPSKVKEVPAVRAQPVDIPEASKRPRSACDAPQPACNDGFSHVVHEAEDSRAFFAQATSHVPHKSQTQLAKRRGKVYRPPTLKD